MESTRRRVDDTTTALATETQPIPRAPATVSVDKNHNATGVVPNAWNNVADFKSNQVDGSPKKRRTTSNVEQDSGAGDRVVDNDVDVVVASARSSSDTNQKVSVILLNLLPSKTDNNNLELLLKLVVLC